MNPIHKLIYTLIASLTLLLVGCGGSSNTLSDADKAKMQRAETQTAALKTAYDAAVAALETLEDDTSDATQAEVDDARTAIEGAETAIEDLGIIRIQTGSGNHMVAQDVEKAREDYDKAKTAYEEARKKYEMEREEADTIAKMNALSVAAEQARKDAEAAKMAAETARMKAETDVETLNRTALRYDSGMYKVGDQSIMPRALKQVIKTTMADGKVKTQTIGSRDISLRGTPITATLKTDDTQEIMVGTYTDSENDNARLRLMDKYIGTKKGNVYSIYVSSRTGSVLISDSTLNNENPYGGLPGQRIMKEDGEFYEVQLPDDQKTVNRLMTIIFPRLSSTSGDEGYVGTATLVDAENRNADADYGIYSFTIPTDGRSIPIAGQTLAAGEKHYLRRVFNRNPQADRSALSKFLYDIIAVVPDVTFPVAPSVATGSRVPALM